jgi:hypothetical protein
MAPSAPSHKSKVARCQDVEKSRNA